MFVKCSDVLSQDVNNELKKLTIPDLHIMIDNYDYPEMVPNAVAEARLRICIEQFNLTQKLRKDVEEQVQSGYLILSQMLKEAAE